MGYLIEKIRWITIDLLFNIMHKDSYVLRKWMAETISIFFYNCIEYKILTRSFEEFLPQNKTLMPIKVQLARLSDLSFLSKIVLPSELERFKKRLINGRICMLAFHKDNLAAYAWATRKIELEIDNLKLKLRPDDIYIDDSFTLEGYRRKGIQTELHIKLLEYMRGNGFKRSIVIVAVDNIPSQKMFKKIGYREADRLTFRRVLIKRYYYYHRGEF